MIYHSFKSTLKSLLCMALITQSLCLCSENSDQKLVKIIAYDHPINAPDVKISYDSICHSVTLKNLLDDIKTDKNEIQLTNVKYYQLINNIRPALKYIDENNLSLFKKEKIDKMKTEELVEFIANINYLDIEELLGMAIFALKNRIISMKLSILKEITKNISKDIQKLIAQRILMESPFRIFYSQIPPHKGITIIGSKLINNKQAAYLRRDVEKIDLIIENLAKGKEERSTKRYSLKALNHLITHRKYPMHNITSWDFDSKFGLLVLLSKDKKIILYDINKDIILHQETSKDPVFSLHLNQKDNLLFVGLEKGIKVITISSPFAPKQIGLLLYPKKPLNLFNSFIAPKNNPAIGLYAPNDKLLFSSHKDGVINAWDLSSYKWQSGVKTQGEWDGMSVTKGLNDDDILIFSYQNRGEKFASSMQMTHVSDFTPKITYFNNKTTWDLGRLMRNLSMSNDGTMVMINSNNGMEIWGLLLLNEKIGNPVLLQAWLLSKIAQSKSKLNLSEEERSIWDELPDYTKLAVQSRINDPI